VRSCIRGERYATNVTSTQTGRTAMRGVARRCGINRRIETTRFHSYARALLKRRAWQRPACSTSGHASASIYASAYSMSGRRLRIRAFCRELVHTVTASSGVSGVIPGRALRRRKERHCFSYLNSAARRAKQVDVRESGFSVSMQNWCSFCARRMAVSVSYTTPPNACLIDMSYG